MLRVIIVDDEVLSIKRLYRLLSESGLVDVCQTFQHPLEAYEYSKIHPVDVAFLDISMPHINGMRLSTLLTELNEKISIIFVTGYKEYAVQAFEINALDYLMKPVNEERIRKTLEKIKKVRNVTESSRDISVFLFNGFKLFLGSTKHVPLKLRSPKTEELFAFLVYKETVSKEEIIDVLWPRLDYDKALSNLNTNLYYIRKALGMSKSHPSIHVTHNGISIDRNRIYCDVYEFERIVKQFRATDMIDPVLVDKVESLYVGPLLNGRVYSWADEWLRNCEQALIALLETASRHCLTEGHYDSAFRYFDQILKLDDLREDIYYEAIRLYVRLGRKADAIRYYCRLEEVLLTELGSKPNPEVSKLIQDMIG